jgi:nicotinamide mononucleotide transporter
MTKTAWAITFVVTAVLLWITDQQAFGKYSPTEFIEVFAVISTGLCVWLAVKNSILTWPIGIVASLLYLYLFHKWGLYADAGLQIVYAVLGVVGWIAWIKRNHKADQEQAFQADRSAWYHIVIVIGCVALGTFLIRDYLIEINGSAPFWDAVLTSGSLGAQYLLIRKRIETWYFWGTVDVFYVWLFIDREYYLTAAIYFVLLMFVVKAAIEWRKLLTQREKSATLME